MTTDNRANGQKSVAAFKDWHAGWWKNLPNPIAESNAQSAFFAGWEAALVAAQGAAPQAESVWIPGYGGTGVNKSVSVLPSSGVDEEKLAEVIRQQFEVGNIYLDSFECKIAARAVAEWLKGQGR